MGRRLGQHFLADPKILDRMVDALNPATDDLVIEIGPGRGSLTARLAPRVGSVIAIEKDQHLADALRAGTGKGERGTVLPANVQVLEGDALRLDWHRLITEQTVPSSPFTLPGFKVVGNIPYYITTPLIDKALTPPAASVIVFLLQREVAERLVASPGTKVYGALSAGVQAVAEVERLFNVRAGAFRPPPNVDSTAVRLAPRAAPLVGAGEQPAWRAFLAALFSQRRKQLSRSLRSLTGWERDRVESLLGALALARESRPEVLSPRELVGLFRAVPR